MSFETAPAYVLGKPSPAGEWLNEMNRAAGRWPHMVIGKAVLDRLARLVSMREPGTNDELIGRAIAELAPLEVHAVWPIEVSDCWMQEVADAAYEHFLDEWDHHYGFSGEDIADARTRDANRAELRGLIAKWASELPVRVYRPKADESRTYSREEAERMMRDHFPLWFVDHPEDEGRLALIDHLTRHGVSQAQLAGALGVTQATVSHWVRGRRIPEAHYREAIERWSGGAVAARSWQTPKERLVFQRVGAVGAER